MQRIDECNISTDSSSRLNHNWGLWYLDRRQLKNNARFSQLLFVNMLFPANAVKM